LSRAASEATRVLDAAGFDDIIIETVGVGQSEVDIVRIADTVVLVSVPGLGDDIQAIKAGVMEIGDVFCVNKSDKDGAERVIREIRSMLETAVLNGAKTRFSDLFAARAALDPSGISTPTAAMMGLPNQGAGHHAAAQIPGHPNLEIPPVVATVAETGQGIVELVDEIKAHEASLVATGFLRSRRESNLAWELGRGTVERILAALEREGTTESMMGLSRAVLDKHMDFYDALDLLQATLVRP